MMKHLLASLMLGSIGITAAVAVTTVAKEAITIKASHTGIAVDKQNNYSPAGIEYNEAKSEAVVTIYNADFSVKKQFTIKNVSLENERSASIVGTYCYGDFLNVDPGSDAIVTQGLYNSDEKWEVVLEEQTPETVKAPDGYEYVNYVRSYKVINEDNATVCVPVVSNDGYGYDYDYLAEYAYVNNRFYSVVEDDDTNTIRFYTYEAGASALPAVPVKMSASRAYPNPLPSGRTLTIEFENQAEAGTVVEVYDMRGRKVCSVAVAEGETKAQVPSRRLRGGNYVYVVNRNGNLVEKGKIIAK